jgi:hypothetical protein
MMASKPVAAKEGGMKQYAKGCDIIWKPLVIDAC